KCRVKHGMKFLDLDHDIPLDLTRLTRDSKTNTQVMPHVCFRVRYPHDPLLESTIPEDAIVVYVQMSLTAGLDLDLRQFRNSNPNFPDEPILNQFFTNDQVESYRQLGYHIGMQILSLAGTTTQLGGCTGAEKWISAFRQSYLAERWQASLSKSGQSFPSNMGDVVTVRSDFEGNCAIADAEVTKFLGDAVLRQTRLVWLESLLNEANSQPLEPGMEKSPGKLVQLFLTAHAYCSGGNYSSAGGVFIAGGRNNLSAIIAWMCTRETADVFDIQNKIGGEENIAKRKSLLAKLIRQLKDDVLISAEIPSIALAVTIFASRDYLAQSPRSELVAVIQNLLECGDIENAARLLANGDRLKHRSYDTKPLIES
ncbi:MAG TPA: hypothetical protein VGM98_11700, partial [Schlesneria sp.]